MRILKNALILFLLLFVFTGCNSKENVVNNSSNVQRLSTANNITNNNSPSNSINEIANETNNTTINEIIVPLNEATNEKSEEELSSFSTKLLTNDNDRENNIEITCSKINQYIVEPGSTFSFTKTVGKATHEKGYEEANVFDANGNTIKGLRWWKLSS